MHSSVSILTNPRYSLIELCPERIGWTSNISDRVVEDRYEILEYGCLRENSLWLLWLRRWTIRRISIIADAHHHTAEDEQHQEVECKELVNLLNSLEHQLNHGSKSILYCNEVHHLQNYHEDQKAIQKWKQHDHRDVLLLWRSLHIICQRQNRLSVGDLQVKVKRLNKEPDDLVASGVL